MKAFEYLIYKKEGRTSDNAKGKYLTYKYLEMAEYLTSIEEDISISEKKWMFKCRIEDINIISDKKWNKDKDPCVHYPWKQLDPNHLLNCQYLIGKNQILSYIPDYMIYSMEL